MEVIAFGVIAFLVLMVSFISSKLEKSFITAPMIFVFFGFLSGPFGFNLIKFPFDNTFLKPASEITLMLILFTDGVRICMPCIYREDRITIRLLTVGIVLSIIFGAAFALTLFPSFGLWQALLLATIVTPTDAALGRSSLFNPKIPEKFREILIFESGMNDGLVLPFIIFFVACLNLASGYETLTYWLFFLVQQIGLGLLIGVATGYLGSLYITWGLKHRHINFTFSRLSSMALAFIAYSLASLTGGNSLIAAFTAGITVGLVSSTTTHIIHEFADAQAELLSLITFFLFGAIFLGPALSSFSWKSVLFACLALTIVRIAAVYISLIGIPLKRKTLLFLGWMGPRGIASFLFGLMMLDYQFLPNELDIVHIVIITVAISIFAHGISSNIIANRFSKDLD